MKHCAFSLFYSLHSAAIVYIFSQSLLYKTTNLPSLLFCSFTPSILNSRGISSFFAPISLKDSGIPIDFRKYLRAFMPSLAVTDGSSKSKGTLKTSQANLANLITSCLKTYSIQAGNITARPAPCATSYNADS